MPKYYKKRYYRGSRDKYSVEQQAGELSVAASQQAYTVVVPDTGVQGMRKVKHLTVSAAANFSTAGDPHVDMFWALVYVPQGTNPSTLSVSGTTGMYEPNQFVMNCGVWDFSAGPCRISSPVSRNLNSGDRIVLIVANPQAIPAFVRYVVRYAITLQ